MNDELPDNVITTDNLVDNLPDNLITTENIESNLPESVITKTNIKDNLPLNVITKQNIKDNLPDNVITSTNISSKLPKSNYVPMIERVTIKSISSIDDTDRILIPDSTYENYDAVRMVDIKKYMLNDLESEVSDLIKKIIKILPKGDDEYDPTPSPIPSEDIGTLDDLVGIVSYLNTNAITKYNISEFLDGYTPELPDNVLTTDNLAENLPSNLITENNIDSHLTNYVTKGQLRDIRVVTELPEDAGEHPETVYIVVDA